MPPPGRSASRRGGDEQLGAYDGPPPEHAPLVATLRDALRYAREREYTGWDYCDGLSNPFREALPVDNRWINLAFQEGVKRSPVNLRPLLGVEQRRNFKGAALFALANLNAHRLRAAGEGGGELGTVNYEREARDLAGWLVETRRSGYGGFCGGHNHEVQHLHAKGEPADPDVVSTAYGVRALLRVGAWTGDEDLPATARTAERFLLEDMNYRETASGARVDYYVHQREGVYLPNAAALAGRLLLDLYDGSDDGDLLDYAERILDGVVACQSAEGGWAYADPPDASHLSMDSHHNGFVLESLLAHGSVTGSDRYANALSNGLSFYGSLFDDDGAPHYDASNAYPRDAHAAAQGILVSTYAGEYDRAERILGWTLEHLHDAGEGRFLYRKGRLLTRQVTLMRWCQAWLCYAISEYLARVRLGTALHDGI